MNIAAAETPIENLFNADCEMVGSLMTYPFLFFGFYQPFPVSPVAGVRHNLEAQFAVHFPPVVPVGLQSLARLAPTKGMIVDNPMPFSHYREVCFDLRHNIIPVIWLYSLFVSSAIWGIPSETRNSCGAPLSSTAINTVGILLKT